MNKADIQVEKMYEWISHYNLDKKAEIYVAYPRHQGGQRMLEEMIIEQR